MYYNVLHNTLLPHTFGVTNIGMITENKNTKRPTISSSR